MPGQSGLVARCVAVCLLACVATALPAQETLVEFGSEWSFFRGTEAPSVPDQTEWRTEGFDDAAWETGPAGFGYGDMDDATVLDDMRGNYTTLYLRQSFDVPDRAALTSLLLSIRYDDGFIGYVNGTEVLRVNADPPDPLVPELNFDDVASAGHEATRVEFFDLTASLDLLRDGTNLIAIEAHNVSLTSSDLSMDLRLSGNDPRAGCVMAVNCASSQDAVTLSWQGTGVVFDEIAITRDGAQIPGSPFAGDSQFAVDTEPGDFNNTYVVTFRIDGVDCDALSCSSTPEVEILASDAEWRYFKGIAAPSDPPTAWREVAFDDADWLVGATGIGYSDGDDTTILDDMQNNYRSIFMRNTFTVTDPAGLSNLVLLIDYDDGFIAYVNGEEVARSANMGQPGEEFAFDAGATAGHEAGNVEGYDISGVLDAINAGENLIALQVHNVNLGSSDLSVIPSILANTCIFNLSCTYDEISDSVTLGFATARPESIRVTRNGVPLPGSPFSGDTTSVVDDSPEPLDNVYEVIATVAGRDCAPVSCQIRCSDREPDALTCSLSVVGGATQAQLSWEARPGAVRIEVLRENESLAILDPAETSYIDPDVESTEPEDDTDFDVVFTFADDATCTIECGPIDLCPTDFLCEVVDVAGTPRVQLTWANVVKEWMSYTVQVDGVDVAVDVPGDATSFTDELTDLIPGELHTYTLLPIAPPGEEVGTACDQSCSVALQLEEIGAYPDPAGGWDYRIDFEAGEDAYNASAGEAGNLDGNWIRSLDRDFWDGSAPGETGAAPDGLAPGGVAIETVALGGACGENIGVLRVLDPGDPSNPGASLATQFPDPYTEPNNRAIVLGMDTGVSDRNLLRDGVTLSMRWRVNPDPPAYLNAQATGDGSPVTNGLGNVGIAFLDDGTLGTAGQPVSLSFALNSGQNLLMSSNPVSTMGAVDLFEFRSLWVTVEDPEGDDTYNVNVYMGGLDGALPILTGADLSLQAADVDFGAPVGNFLTLGMPSNGNDGDVQIDYISYREGIHPPAAGSCGPGGGEGFRRGDTDGSGLVDISDPIFNLTFQFVGGIAQLPCEDAADVDGSGLLDISDPIYNLTFQFVGGIPPPPPPGPSECGPDPAAPADNLGCDAYPQNRC